MNKTLVALFVKTLGEPNECTPTFFTRVNEFLEQQGLKPVTYDEWLEVREIAFHHKVGAIKKLRELTHIRNPIVSFRSGDSTWNSFLDRNEIKKYGAPISLGLTEAKGIIDTLIADEAIFSPA